jgi:hypothetical protein
MMDFNMEMAMKWLNIFKPKQKDKPKNIALYKQYFNYINRLSSLIIDDNIENKLKKPINRITQLNVHYTDMFELMDNFYSVRSVHDITSVSSKKYFDNILRAMDIQTALKRISDMIMDTKKPLSKVVLEDLDELLDYLENLT